MLLVHAVVAVGIRREARLVPLDVGAHLAAGQVRRRVGTRLRYQRIRARQQRVPLKTTIGFCADQQCLSRTSQGGGLSGLLF